MDIPKICQKYFQGFHDLFESKSTVGKRVAGVVKILSYFTVVIPLGFATVYALSALYGRVMYPAFLTSTIKKVETLQRQTDFSGALPASSKGLSASARASIKEGDAETFKSTLQKEKLTLQQAFETVCELETEDPDYIHKLVKNHRPELNLEKGMWSALLYGNTVAVECLLGYVDINKSGSPVGSFLHRYAAGGLNYIGLDLPDVDASIETYGKILELLAKKIGMNAENQDEETAFDIFCSRGWATADFAERYQVWMDLKADTKKKTAKAHLKDRLEAYKKGDRGTIKADADYQAMLNVFNSLSA